MQIGEQRIKVIKALWLLACFVIGLAHFGRGAFAEASMAGLLGWMTLITFPSGYLAIFLIRALVWFFPDAGGAEMTRAYYYSLSLWVLMTSLGYFQWFYLLPWLLRRLKIIKTN